MLHKPSAVTQVPGSSLCFTMLDAFCTHEYKSKEHGDPTIAKIHGAEVFRRKKSILLAPKLNYHFRCCRRASDWMLEINPPRKILSDLHRFVEEKGQAEIYSIMAETGH